MGEQGGWSSCGVLFSAYLRSQGGKNCTEPPNRPPTHCRATCRQAGKGNPPQRDRQVSPSSPEWLRLNNAGSPLFSIPKLHISKTKWVCVCVEGGGPANTSYPQGSRSLAKVQEAKEKEPPDPWDQQEVGGALHHFSHGPDPHPRCQGRLTPRRVSRQGLNNRKRQTRQ